MTPELWTFAGQILEAVKLIVLAWIAFETSRQRGVIVTLEQNTNSIKDALVQKTDEEAFARGKKDEKDRTEEVNRQVEEAKKIAP